MNATLNTTEEINAMECSLKTAGLFAVERTPETIIAKHIKSGKEVLRALKKSARENVWITRTHPKLWA